MSQKETILNLFSECFNVQLKIQRFIHKHFETLNKIYHILYALIFTISYIYSLLKKEVFLNIVSWFCVAFIIVLAIQKINSMTTSVCSFLMYGIVAEAVSFWGLYYFISQRIITSNSLSKMIIEYFIIIFVLLITWNFYSIITNNKVATLVNILLSSLFGILILIKDFLFEIIPNKLFNDDSIEAVLLLTGYSEKQLLNIGINAILLPFLITNIIATLMCSIKGYWINKYNDGIDITMELIENDTIQSVIKIE